MNEDMPELSIDLGGNEFIATPLNATLYTFLGQSALPGGEIIENSSRNHLFLQTGETYQNEEERDVFPGAYVFGEAVQRIGTVMLQMQFPAEINKWTIHPSDEAAYQVYVSRQETADDIDDFVPEDWK
jgi:hypothetical protein